MLEIVAFSFVFGDFDDVLITESATVARSFLLGFASLKSIGHLTNGVIEVDGKTPRELGAPHVLICPADRKAPCFVLGLQ